MKKMRRSLAAIGLCGLMAQPLAALAAGKDMADANVGHGQALFSSCAICHGAKGEGGHILGAPKIAGMPAAAVMGMLNVYHKGGKIGPKSYYMDAVTKHMTHDELRDLSAYIATMGKDDKSHINETEPTDN